MIIYLLTAPSGRHYVGQTHRDLDVRWSEHISHATTGKHDWPLHRAIRKHGADGWSHRVIWTCSSQEHMDIMEGHFIATMGSLNASIGGAAPGIPSAETRRKMSVAGKGKPKSAAHCKAISDAQIAGGNMARTGPRKPPPPFTKEHRAKIAAAGRGRKHSEESKRKMSESATGKTHTEETRAKLREHATGRKASDEARAKMSASRKGRKHTPESRAKMSVAQLLRHAREKLERDERKIRMDKSMDLVREIFE